MIDALTAMIRSSHAQSAETDITPLYVSLGNTIDALARQMTDSELTDAIVTASPVMDSLLEERQRRQRTAA